MVGVTGRELAVANGSSAGSVRGSGLMLMLVAFATDQVMVEMEPAWMVVGVALNVMTGGPGLTATLTADATLPPALVAVSVYVAEAVGVKVTVPLTAKAGDPAARGSGDKVTDVAFAVVQVRVTGLPVVIPDADDENELMVGGGVGGGGVGVAAPAPPQAVKTVMSNNRKVRRSSLKTRANLCTGRKGPCSALPTYIRSASCWPGLLTSSTG